MVLPLSLVVNVSVALTPAGVGAYNTSNTLLVSSETPLPSFGAGDFKIYFDPTDVANDFGTASITYALALSVFSQSPNIRAGSGYLVVAPLESSEAYVDCLARIKSQVHFMGILFTDILSGPDALAVAAWTQPFLNMAFLASHDVADLDETTGWASNVKDSGYSRTRVLGYYSGTSLDALKFAAGYCARGLSVNFSGSNTTITMQLKDIVGIVADSAIDPTLYLTAKAAGVDVYASLEGLAKVMTSGANRFFDQVYNLIWVIGALQVNGINALATTSTKVPQTENGVDVLRNAYTQVSEQAVTNAYIAPGKWTSPVTFGNQEEMLASIAERGYYIYFQPIAEQSQTERDDRVAPLCQIAYKEAGAIHSSNVIININA